MGAPYGEGSANFEAMREWNHAVIYRKTIAYFADQLVGRGFSRPSFRDGPKDQTSDVQLHIGESRDSGFDAVASPRNDEFIGCLLPMPPSVNF